MNLKFRRILGTFAGLGAMAVGVQLTHATTFLTQDFDTDPADYTTTEFFVADHDVNLGTRYYNFSDAAGISLNPGITGATGRYIAVQDADTSSDAPISPAYSTADPPTLTFSPVNFALGAGEQLQLSISLAGLPTVETENYIRAQVDLDNTGNWTNIFQFRGTNNSPYINTADPNNVQSLSGAFASFSYPIPTPIDGVLRLRVQSFNDTNSLNEASGYDNIKVDTFVPVPPTPQFGTALVNIATGFAEPAPGSISYVRGTNPPGIELGFLTVGGAIQGVTDYSGDQQFKVNNAAATFRSELIDLRTTGSVTAGIDLRTYAFATASGFETDDFLTAFVEVSTDGVTFTRINFFDSHGDGVPGVDNPLDALNAGNTVDDTGPFTHFSFLVPDNIETMRFGIDAQNNSGSEFFVWDNLSAFLAGDTDQSGTVEFADLGNLLNSYNQSGAFENGDFDGDGLVNFSDLGILLNNYNQSVPTLAASAPVPEPSSILLAGLGLAGLLCLRRRKSA